MKAMGDTYRPTERGGVRKGEGRHVILNNTFLFDGLGYPFIPGCAVYILQKIIPTTTG
jgi:hypothetical protein